MEQDKCRGEYNLFLGNRGRLRVLAMRLEPALRAKCADLVGMLSVSLSAPLVQLEQT